MLPRNLFSKATLSGLRLAARQAATRTSRASCISNYTTISKSLTFTPSRSAINAQTAGASSIISKRFMGHVVNVRDARFKKLTQADVEKFEAILPKQRVYVSADLGGSYDAKDLDAFNCDWLEKYKGHSQVVLFPTNAKEVSELLKYCNEQTIAVVPQGGNTCLVGGSVPVFDEVIISLSKMNQIRSLDKDSGALVCDAGCILENLDNYVAEFGLTMPIDLGAKGSCHIGGNVSTNAGGIRYIRYGSLHGSVLGLEVVLPDGTIINNLSTLRKDSTGYDLKQLFIGAEGTIGIVTGVSILAALLGANSYEDVKSTFRTARTHLCEILSAFEFWDAKCMDITADHFNMSKPLEGNYPFYVLIETSGSNNEHDSEKLNNFIELTMEEGLIQDGVLAQDKSQINKFWVMREGIPESLAKFGATYKYDISIPIAKLYDIVPDIKKRLTEAGVYSENESGTPNSKYPVKSVNGYGHIGDGNLHLNIVADKFDDNVTKHLEPYIYEWVENVAGSISAEHGLGIMKPDCLKYTKGPEMIHNMKVIKNLFDPNGIMNPYKFLPAN
ncbi:hypothetical protein BB561_004626 [Smittium simulii]|uniref:FAD-binding PCMH-type domain-containing protein n=1 Tax=Smittium simulii TaxID=133385 RepID=A0A2T9YF61_9FUNG|nr:hypothetical protein BB561_004626 [Smittium simulii]